MSETTTTTETAKPKGAKSSKEPITPQSLRIRRQWSRSRLVVEVKSGAKHVRPNEGMAVTATCYRSRSSLHPPSNARATRRYLVESVRESSLNP